MLVVEECLQQSDRRKKFVVILVTTRLCQREQMPELEVCEKNIGFGCQDDDDVICHQQCNK